MATQAQTPKTDATFVAYPNPNAAIEGLLGTSIEGLPSDIVAQVARMSNEELFPRGEKALRDIADEIIVLAEVRNRFGRAKGAAILGYQCWKEFVEKNSRYSVRTIQRRLNEVNGKDKTKINKPETLAARRNAEEFPDAQSIVFPASFETFLTKDEADELERNLEGLKWERPTTRWGLKQRREVTTGWISANALTERNDIQRNDLETAPEFIREFARKLSAHTGYDINYVSPNKYADREDKMDFHKHKEDHWHNSPVWVVSVGAERQFGMREIATPKNKSSVLARHGSLITMSPESNWTHEHAVLPDKTMKTVRYSLNCKSIPTCAIWDCHAGKKYPSDAVYVGCRVLKHARGEVLREGTIFGNGTNPLVSHDGALETEAEFREYANRKMQDPEFAEQVHALKDKHLLCWCVQSGPKRTPFCHARIWFELANGYPYPTPMSSLPRESLMLKAPAIEGGDPELEAMLAPLSESELESDLRFESTLEAPVESLATEPKESDLARLCKRFAPLGLEVRKSNHGSKYVLDKLSESQLEKIAMLLVSK